MAEEKTYTQIVDEAHYKDHMGLTIPIHASKKYKKHGKLKEAGDRFAGQELKSGSRIIAAESMHNNPVYMLCTVLDFEDSGEWWWGSTTRLIVQVNDVSQSSAKDQIGRLRTVRICDPSRFFKSVHLIEIGKANWEKYIPGRSVET